MKFILQLQMGLQYMLKDGSVLEHELTPSAAFPESINGCMTNIKGMCSVTLKICALTTKCYKITRTNLSTGSLC